MHADASVGGDRAHAEVVIEATPAADRLGGHTCAVTARRCAARDDHRMGKTTVVLMSAALTACASNLPGEAFTRITVQADSGSSARAFREMWIEDGKIADECARK